VVGLSATIMDIEEVHALAAAIKASLPRVKVVLGGPYVSSCRDLAVMDRNIDVAVIGEGEETLVEQLDAFESGQQDLSGVRGLACLEDGEPRFTGPRPPIADIDDLDCAWDLLRPESYFSPLKRNSHNRIRKHHRVMTLFSSRGCPYNCIFCHNMFGKRVRYASAQRIAEEISYLRGRYDVRELEFVDDNFNQREGRAEEVFRLILDRDLGMHYTFPNGLRGDRLGAELLDLFKEAGVFRVSLAVESGSPRIQELIRKKLDLDRIAEAIRMTAERGIVTVGFFLFGFPGETVEEMRQTIDFACASAVHVADFFCLNPYPGTPVAEQCGIAPGSIAYDDFSAMPVNLSAASDAELRRMMKTAYRRFYTDPRRVLRILKVVPKNHMLLLNAIITARLFFQDAVSK